MACKRAARVFFPAPKGIPGFWTMSIPEIVRIVGISVFIDFGTCLKRRVPHKSGILAVLARPDLDGM